MKTLLTGCALFVLMGIAVVACGGHPGGTVGDACSEVGSAEECFDDEICEELSGYGAYCLLLCDDHEDCDAGEQCNGVSGSNEKGCHPADDVDEE
jgi:hypothetical protein